MTTNLFPMAFVDPIVERLKIGLQTDQVFPRSLGINEGTDAVGVFPALWQPVEGTKLMGQTNLENTISVYIIRVQNLRIDADELEGRRLFNNTCRKIRAILVRDVDLQVSLLGLTETLVGVAERVKKYDVTKQDYLNAKINNGLVYLCTTELRFETESTPAP